MSFREDDMTVDEGLRAALTEANLPTLLLVLFQLTGDERWLGDDYRPRKPRGLEDNDSAGLDEGRQQEVRSAALGAISNFRAGRLSPVELDPERISELLGFALAEKIPEEYGELLAEEMGLRSRDIQMDLSEHADEFEALIIGSGISGLCAAIKLEQAGVPYRVLEKNSSVGGTWLENRYPGCGVDTPSHLYSFSFAMNTAWDFYFAKRGQVHDYLEQLADRYDVRRRVQFETEVLHAEFDEARGVWVVDVRHGEAREQYTANVLITGVGMVNRPAIPALAGAETFAGPAMHTAAWDESVDLAGKRVAVIGTGASAMQLVPAIADSAEHVTVFQRSPHWALPHPNYHRPVTDHVKQLLDEVPFYAAWYRLRAFWNFGDRLHSSFQIDPEWPHPDRSINASNERHRVFLTDYIKRELGGREDLIEGCLPTYPPYGKRPLIDNRWYQTLCREDVSLVTHAVTEIRPDEVVDDTGAAHAADVIIYATGFRTLQMLWPMEIVGRSGRSLRDVWGEEDARAYLGITMPDFPNLFFLNGPNTSAGHGGSAVLASEFQMRYVMQLVERMIEDRLSTVEVRREVFEAYQDEVDEALSKMIWSHPGMTTYYRNSAGRVVTTSPWKYIDYWARTRDVDLDEFITTTRDRAAA